ncbi:hypothetical protein D3C71_440580 [compost metagenome]
MLLHVVANEEVRRGAGRRDADLLALDRLGLGRIEIGVVLAGENQTRVTGKLHEADHVLVLRLHLDRMIVETHGNVGGTGNQCLKHLRAALGKVLGRYIKAFLLVEA